MESFKQNWWMWLAGVIGAVQLVLGIGSTFFPEGGQTNSELLASRIIGILGATAGVAIFVGLRQLAHNRRLGGSLIVLGTLPAAISGVVFFWFPPMWAVTAAGIAVITKAMSARRGSP